LADLLRRLSPDEVEIGVDYLTGSLRQGRIGIGWASLFSVRDGTPAAPTPSLTLLDVDATFARLAAVKGAGSTAERRRLLGELVTRATPDERDFLLRLVLGELRQGAVEGVVVEAV